MKFGSLFTGVGGFDLGFERAGMECAWQVEFDKACQSVLKKHWSETELFDDVRTVGKHNLEPVDVICGGFPCQDVSIAGKRAGLAGERSGLWSEFARIIDELEPKWVVIENVPGLLSSNRGRDFATVIRWLAERGYGVAWRILDSQYFGVAQRRRRVFIVGSFGNGSASEILFEREGVRWNTEKGRKTGEDVAATIAGGSSKCHSDITSGQQDANVIVMSSGQANAEIMSERRTALTGLHEQPIVVLNDQGGSQMSVTENVSATLRSQEHGHQPIIFNAGDRRQGVDSISNKVSPAIQAKSGTGGNNMPMVLGFDLAQITSKLNYSNPKKGDPQPPLNTLGQGFVAYENHPADSRITETGSISQQLTSRMGTGGNNVPLVQKLSERSSVRRLTPTECERLQGFPDGWTDGQADSHRYKQMGNAVTVNVAEWIGKRIEVTK